MKKIAVKVFVLLVGLITASISLIIGTYAMENDLIWVGYCFIMFSLFIILTTNGYLFVEEIRNMLEKMKIQIETDIINKTQEGEECNGSRGEK